MDCLAENNMKLTIVGDGSFGRFLKELLAPHFELCDSAQSIILAVPASSYNACGRFYGSNLNNHLINVCSVQKPTTDNLLTYTEESPINPYDYYGWNKSTTEKLLDMEHDNHTILRASNVFGFEYQRKSYMGFLMNQLKDKGNIEIDISPFTTRDFISVQDTSKLINLVVDKEIKGTYNLSSGIGEVVGYTADYLIKGYGGGSLISKSKERKDQFILDNKKLLNALNIDIEFNIEDQIIKLGEQLCRI